MLRELKGLKQQRGIIVAFTAVAMVALLALMGLALDMAHAFVNKTRLQNSVDATALAAAKELDETGSTVAADLVAHAVFAANASAQGNSEINDAVTNGLAIQTAYSDTLYPFVPGGLNPQYVRVTAPIMQLQSWFIRVLGFNNKNVSASAVGGPSPTLELVCNVAPIMVCGVPDSDPNDGEFYGYDVGEVEILKTSSGSGGSWDVGPGNFQLVRLDGSAGGADVRESLAGSYDACLALDEGIPTEPGNTIGPVYQGLNTRLGVYSGPMSGQRAAYPPDLVTQQNTAPVTAGMPQSNLTYSYNDYVADMTAENYDQSDGVAGRRILRIPIGRCDGATNGQGTVDLLNFGCFYLLQEVGHQGNDAEMYGQFIGGCNAQGIPGPAPDNGPGPYIIQLYEDTSTQDS